MNRLESLLKTFSLGIILCLLIAQFELSAQILDTKFYNIGSPTLINIWVDPVNGNDNSNGLTRSSAVRTINAAWSLIPGTTTTTGYKICLTAGNYIYRDKATNNIVGLYLDERHGSYNFPIVIEAVDGSLTANIYSSIDFRDIKYLYLIGLNFITSPDSDGGGNTVHFANGDHILIRNCNINGFDGTIRKPQETLKVNQVKYIYVENCDISGAFWFALDYVGVQYGHIQESKIHDASEDCLLLKGGSAQILVESNQIYNSGRFGFSAGQGAGFDFMVFPWLHYEAYDLKFCNNIIYNTNYSGIAVLGGYNILIAYNTLYKVGIDKSGDRTLLNISLGQRGCDGAENDTCNVHHQYGGWSPGPWSTPPIPPGTEEVDCIPNKNVFIYNNIFYNPGNDSTSAQHFEIREPYNAYDHSATFLQSCNLPNPVLSDDNLQIKGNLIWNGSKGKLLINNENSGAQDSNPTCNRVQLLRDNIINTIEPQFVNHAALNFHPIVNSNIFSIRTFGIPDFTGTDKPSRPQIPTGNLLNIISRDYEGRIRTLLNTPGAFAYLMSTKIIDEQNIPDVYNYSLEQNYPNPFNPTTTIMYSIPLLENGKKNNVTLKIFDLLGREITTLVNESKEAGNYYVTFNATGLPSSIYLYKLNVGEYSEIKKMLLIK